MAKRCPIQPAGKSLSKAANHFFKGYKLAASFSYFMPQMKNLSTLSRNFSFDIPVRLNMTTLPFFISGYSRSSQ